MTEFRGKGNPYGESDNIFTDLSDELNLEPVDIQKEQFTSLDARIRKAVADIATQIRALPHDAAYPDLQPQAYLVGGFVRDTLRGQQPKDADIEIYGVEAGRLEMILDKLFEEKVNKVGKAFGIFKIDLGDGLDCDISIPREESKMDESVSGTNAHKNFLVKGDPSMSIKEAARRRDFTFNTLAMDPLTGKIVDSFGGISDIEHNILRVTDPERFQDDPLRVYRAIQFVARMGLTVEEKSFALMKQMVERGALDGLTRERIKEEWTKLLLKSKEPSKGLTLARELGIIERYYPALHALIGTEQEPEWHPEGDVWIHTLMVIDEAAKIVRNPQRNILEEEKMPILFGAVAHDFGKPATTVYQDGRWKSHGHEEAGEQPAREFGAWLKLSGQTIEAMAMIAKEHLKVGMYYRNRETGKMDDKQYVNAVRRLLKRIHPVSWRVLLASCEADSRGRTIPGVQEGPYLPGDLFAKVIQEHRLDENPKETLIQGRDIISRAKELGMNIQPGVIFRDLIRAVEAKRDTGEIITKEEGLAELNKILLENHK